MIRTEKMKLRAEREIPAAVILPAAIIAAVLICSGGRCGHRGFSDVTDASNPAGGTKEAEADFVSQDSCGK
ncbi:MAG: hypothetical protein Q4C58_00785 [Eubacteriales bacterium]|nr:hypothetical protein [Eubacteriales bacterium]